MTFLENTAEYVAPFLYLHPTQMWPISLESAPFLIILWLCLIIALSRFFTTKKDSAHEAVKKKRYDAKMKALKNLILMEERRLANEARKMNNKSSTTEENANDVCSDDQPPTAKYVYDIVFERVEEEPIDKAIGIPKDDMWFLRAVILLKQRIKLEVKEAKKYTTEAQCQLINASMKVTKEQQLAADHQDGEKLSKLLEFVKEEFAKKFVKQFGKTVQVPDKIEGVSLSHFDEFYLQEGATELGMLDSKGLAAAEKVLADVRTAQRNALMFIFDILRPVLPTYGLALLFKLFARALESPLWAQCMPAYKASVARINPNATAGEFGFAPDILTSAQGHLILFIVGFLFSRPIEMMASILVDKAARDFSGPLRKAVMGSIMKQDTEYFDFNPSAVLQERLNRDTDELVENMLKVPQHTLEFVFRVIQRTVTLYFVAPAMLWACLSFNVPLFSIIIIATSKPLRRLYGQRARSNESATADTLEILQNIHTVRQFSMEKEEKNKYTLGNTTRNIFESRIRVIESFTRNMRFVVNIAGQIYVIYIALTLAVDGKASVSDAIVASTVGTWLQHDMKNLMEQVPKLLKIMKPVHRVSSLLACKPRIEQDPACPDAKLLRPNRFQGHIEFRDVTFSYPKERQKQVLNGLSFTAKPGQKVAFVGKAGCGKSTSMDLLQRFYNRTGGSIRVDGELIEKYDTNVLRKHCGVVAQTNVLFARSIYDNIVYGMEHPPGPESAEFLEVCRQAQAWEFIQKFPNKQYTRVGEDGVKLSGGQKQRIAIARVIIRQPTFLFLDEATSALDAINEKAVQQALDKMLAKFNGVAIVVAHRLTTICNCDNIVVMGDGGTKVEEGTHEELLKVPKQVDEDGKPVVGPGLYHTLWDTQQMGSAKSGEIEKELLDQVQEQQTEIEMLKRELNLLLQIKKENQTSCIGTSSVK